MAESATAESAYFHTLIARPYFFPTETRDQRLSEIVARLPDLPTEIRLKIFEHAFRGNRVAVTAESGCYCASRTTGPYRPDHKWLLGSSLPSQVREEAQRAFVQIAMLEIHCKQALSTFVGRMTALRYLDAIRHIRMNVYELDLDWNLDIRMFPKLQSVTFAPWQKGWTIVTPEYEHSEHLADANVMLKLWNVLNTKTAYNLVVQAYKDKSRRYKMYFVFPIRFHLHLDEAKPHLSGSQPRWQLCVWRANLDKGTIERTWKEVHLVQEATLD